VRKAPEVSYDAPASYVDGLADTDECYGFASQPDRYDWKYVGKSCPTIKFQDSLPAAMFDPTSRAVSAFHDMGTAVRGLLFEGQNP